MHRLVFAAALASLAVAAAAPRGAGAQEIYTRTGFYLGAGAAIGVNTFEDELDTDVRASVGPDFVLGYRAHPYLAVEAQTTYYGLQEFEEDDNRDGNEVELDPLVFTVNAKAYPIPDLLLEGRVQPFVLFGMGLFTADIRLVFGDVLTRDGRDTDFAMRFGGGVEYYATDNWQISAQATYVLPTGNVSRFDFVSIRPLMVSYRF